MAGAIGTGWSEAYMGGSPEAEAALLADVLPAVERIQDVVARRQSAQVRRAFHNKGRPLAIEYTVDPDVPEPFRVPFLREGATYRGFARFSRSQSFRASDGELDQRGFAFRIETDAGPQDILLSNTPVSFARDPVEFLTVARMFVESRKPIAALRVIRALGIREGLRVILNLVRVPDRSIAFTSLQYWTRTPFAFGEAAARLTARPVGPVRRVAAAGDPDYLSTDLAAELAAGPRTFELVALPFVDERRTPIEDASREWPESISRPVVLGRVTLLQQSLTDPESVVLAERVERTEGFNPFTSPGLRPLGRTNRARQRAYARSARHRGAGASSAAPAAGAAPADPPAAAASTDWQPGPGVFDQMTAKVAAWPHRAIWGYGGAAFAALFAFWMLFTPWPMELFAWNVHPRLAQAFIGAGYVFRTLFFLNAATENDWRRLRWIVAGNLAFTGTLLLATYWHMAEFHWDIAHVTPFAHIWLILYIFEPVAMLYLIPRGAFALPPTRTGGPIHPLFRAFLIGTAMLLLTNGLMLVINPEFAAARWPWPLEENGVVNGLDARIMAAWFLGWAVWTGSMARARDWDEIRTPARLFVVNALALFIALALNGSGFRNDDVHTPQALLGGVAVLGGAMAAFHWLQERRRPA